MPFHLGDPVRWLSQGRGSITDKYGVVVDIIPPGQLPDRERWGVLHKMNRTGSTPRERESYVIQAGTQVCWPHPWKLRAVDGEILRLRLEAIQMRGERDGALLRVRQLEDQAKAQISRLLARIRELERPVGAASDLTV
jgi:hypothetical protein